MVKVTVLELEAHGFRLGDGGSSDLFLILSTGAEYEAPIKTTVHEKAKDTSMWSDHFVLNLPTAETPIKVTLVDKNSIQKDESLGVYVPFLP